MSLTEERTRDFDQIGYYLPHRYQFIYRKIPNSVPTLQILHLFQWQPYLCIAAFGCALFLMKIVASRFFEKRVIVDMTARTAVVIALFVLIFWRYFASTIVLVFNTPEPLQKSIKGTVDLVRGLETGKYTGLAHSNAALINFLNPKKFTEKSDIYNRLAAAAITNPPELVIENRNLAEKILKSEKNYVAVVGLSALNGFLSSYCGLEYSEDDALPMVYYTMYGRKNDRLRRLDPARAAVVELEFERLNSRLHPPKPCNRDSVSSMDEITARKPLNIHQVRAALIIGGLLLATAGTVFVLECLTGLATRGSEGRKVPWQHRKVVKSQRHEAMARRMAAELRKLSKAERDVVWNKLCQQIRNMQ